MKNKKNSLAYRLFHRYFIVAMNGMALGLFSTLIIGLIINQIGQAIPGSLGSFLVSISPFATASLSAIVVPITWHVHILATASNSVPTLL
ncbi:MAG: PTS sugar transporter subunit IIC, partial [Peptostreptococcus sp.]